MKYDKPPVTIPDQIQKLKERGLIISDEKEVFRYLSNISFYRFRAYTYPFQENKDINHPFIGNVSFDQIVKLYNFDRQLRLLVFDAIERIEIAFRTQIIYHMSIRHGSHWHLNQELYKDSNKYISQLGSLQREINRSNETFIKHYKKKYKSPIDPPCWMSLEVVSLGLLSRIFQNIKSSPEKKAVTRHFGLYGNDVLENWMHNLCNVRNICAHHSRLWNRRISSHLLIPKKTQLSYLENKNFYPYKLYSSLSTIVYFLNIISPESKFKKRLIELVQTSPENQIKEMGFPKDWKSEKFWF